MHRISISTSCQHPDIVKNVLDVDKELKPDFVSRSIEVQGSNLITTFEAVSLRTLRTSTNAFLDNLKLVIQAIDTFDAPNYRPTDVPEIKEGSKERDRHGVESK
ncbi:hypothetical protein E3Q18_00536 [Wallemia mellicola]|uniref:Transcription factor Pcc1 n=1 Tax=Wallemia mellicola TaxID=1708541 RepID=A0A4T0NZI4_9BASI|nr:hypothetical protein E3Q24_02128 [Wallemia mellicola]TIB88751.1 hypothetical protein E3Q21_00875 [Wallemia mellicola]TIB91431.1 hypothetical protein E3Q20_00861 [Wallemia mellicola]TIB94034.1 hypothetical protein E3Q19_00668 [Wallemia mellicola]TIC01811.1 hypothetical protein E3Q18_00536 [Wallemia mellicola]